MENKDVNIKLLSILNDINKKLDRIEERLIKLEKTQDKMDTHIDFIEDVYDNIKHPLNYVTNKVNNYLQLSNSNNLELNDHK
jgi:hypothetical protein